MNELFHRFASRVAHVAGSARAFVVALTIVLVWLLTGPIFHFSDTWQLFINTGTTIVTFLMVFLIQNTQNRDGKALQLKLNELLAKTKGIPNEYVSLEDMPDEKLDELHDYFRNMHNIVEKHRAERGMKPRP